MEGIKKRRVDRLNWLATRLPFMAYYTIREEAEELCFSAYNNSGLDSIKVYNESAKMAEGICKYLGIPKKGEDDGTN